MQRTAEQHEQARVVAVCISGGGVPKQPRAIACVTSRGIAGDAHAHAKHNRADRAISLLDLEIMRDLIAEGFPLAPGVAGENVTVENLHVQRLVPGTLLEMGDVVLQLEQPRKPCFVLDVIHPQLKEAIVNRCGYLASVVRGGMIRPGMVINVNSPDTCEDDNRLRKPEHAARLPGTGTGTTVLNRG